MGKKRTLLATLAVFVFAVAWNGFVHGVILVEANRALETVARAPEDRDTVLSLFITAGLALLFVFSFARAWPRRRLRDGLVHGLFFAAFAGLMVDLNQYVTYPLPAYLAAAWFAFGVLEFGVYGILASLILRRTDAA